MRGFLERNWETDQCKEDVIALKRQVTQCTIHVDLGSFTCQVDIAAKPD